MNKYNVLICGTGNQGAFADAPGSGNEEKIISFAHAFKENDGFELIGLIDTDRKKLFEASNAWDCPCYDNLKHMKLHNKKQIDIAVISTPDKTHYEILKQLAEYPLKLVICEKPICEDLQQAKEIVQLYKNKGIPLAVNYTRNFLPYYEDLKQRYKSGEFGKIVSANVVFNRGWKHTATHAISFLDWFFDGSFNGKIMECETDYRIWQMDLYFEKYHWREERIGDMPVWEYYDKSHWHIIENAYNFLEGKEPLKCTGEDGLKALEICFELMKGEK